MSDEGFCIFNEGLEKLAALKSLNINFSRYEEIQKIRLLTW